VLDAAVLVPSLCKECVSLKRKKSFCPCAVQQPTAREVAHEKTPAYRQISLPRSGVPSNAWNGSTGYSSCRCFVQQKASGHWPNGERFETYTIKGEKYLATLNGPAAQKLKDDIIIISYATMEFEAAKTFKPWVIFPNENDNSLT
jgi:hypothetical protein